MNDARRAALRERILALAEESRQALAARLAGDSRPEGKLVAYLVLQEPGEARELPTDAQLRDALAERLPAHMIPARFVVLERLPRTAAGKLDRGALARAAGTQLSTVSRPIVAPRSNAEVTLAAIWRDVLRIDEVGVHDDFFEIGGDSLLSIRVIARAGRAGISIPLERFFENPTIAHLAAVAGESTNGAAGARIVEPEPVVAGEAPLTPIQHWFFDAITDHRAHWNQSILLEVDAGAGRAVVENAVRALVAHHDALRLRFIRRDGEWRQDFLSDTASVPLRTVDLTASDPAIYADRVAGECDLEQASLRLEEGRLFRCVWFEGARGWRRLFVLAHHLIVDAVSWDVLLEDLAALLRLTSDDAPPRLPARTASAREWATRLAAEAAAPHVRAGADQWLRLSAGASPSVHVDVDGAESGNTAGDAARFTVTLDETESTRLLSDAAKRFGATPQALLLAAVLLAWRGWTGERDLRLDVEGHGRDALGDAIDVSRTVGWFTTVFPVRLASRGSPDDTVTSPAEVVAAVQATLSALPMRGASHGMLRWLSPDAALRKALGECARPALLFNYLGARGGLPPDAPIRIAREPHGRSRSPGSPRAYVLEVNAYVQSGMLTLDIEYSRRLHRPDSIARLGAALGSALSTFATNGQASFALARLDEAAMSRVAELLAEIDDV
ncbi:MAG TPA: condensation domain-containing protein [Gemmatimonadaceae bacterium]|nr:condensation domain-containing protein [Gemmatimonadaceae bacterium]